MVFFSDKEFTNEVESFIEWMADIGPDMEQDLKEHKDFVLLTLHRIDLMTDDSNQEDVHKCLRDVLHEWKTEYSNPKNLRLEFAMMDFIDWFKEMKSTQEVLTWEDEDHWGADVEHEEKDGEMVQVYAVEL